MYSGLLLRGGEEGQKSSRDARDLKMANTKKQGGGEKKSATSKYRGGGGGQKTFPGSVLFCHFLSHLVPFSLEGQPLYTVYGTLCVAARLLLRRKEGGLVLLYTSSPSPLAGVSRLRVPLFSRGDSSLYEQRERRRRRRRRRRGGGTSDTSLAMVLFTLRWCEKP